MEGKQLYWLNLPLPDKTWKFKIDYYTVEIVTRARIDHKLQTRIKL